MTNQSTPLLSRLLLVVLLAVPGLALAELELKSAAYLEVAVKGKDGKVQKKRQPVSTAVPGSEVIYVISYRNGGAKPATDVVINNPVPPAMRYVPGSAEGAGTRTEVSVDGKRFGALESLTVTGADGKPRAATGDDVTQLRWTFAGAIAPGKDGSVSFRAVVR